MALPLLFVKKTPIVGEFCTNLQRASAPFTPSKQLSSSFVWHKIPSTIVVFLICRVGEFCTNRQRTSTPCTPSKQLSSPFVWHKIPSTIVVFFVGEIGEIGEIFNPQFSILNSK